MCEFVIYISHNLHTIDCGPAHPTTATNKWKVQETGIFSDGLRYTLEFRRGRS